MHEDADTTIRRKPEMIAATRQPQPIFRLRLLAMAVWFTVVLAVASSGSIAVLDQTRGWLQPSAASASS